MFEWITRTIATLGYAGVAALTFLENLFPPIPSELGVRTFVSLPAGFARMPRGCIPRVLGAGHNLWTVALAYAGVALQSNFERVGDYVNTATNVLLAVVAGLMIKRYDQCWRSRTAEQ